MYSVSTCTVVYSLNMELIAVLIFVEMCNFVVCAMRRLKADDHFQLVWALKSKVGVSEMKS